MSSLHRASADALIVLDNYSILYFCVFPFLRAVQINLLNDSGLEILYLVEDKHLVVLYTKIKNHV